MCVGVEGQSGSEWCRMKAGARGGGVFVVVGWFSRRRSCPRGLWGAPMPSGPVVGPRTRSSERTALVLVVVVLVLVQKMITHPPTPSSSLHPTPQLALAFLHPSPYPALHTLSTPSFGLHFTLPLLHALDSLHRSPHTITPPPPPPLAPAFIFHHSLPYP